MENDILFEVDGASAEKNSIFVWDPSCVNTDMECIVSELDQSAVYTEADNGHRSEIAPCLVVKAKDESQGSLLDPFNHLIKPNPECTGFVTEQSPTNQEAEADNQHCIEPIPCLVEKNEDKKQSSLFAPFSHQMNPDPDYVRFISERSASNQEATTKLINERYKWIMESAAIRKEKEQNIREYAKKSTQLSNIIDSKKVVKTAQLSLTAVDDTAKTTELLHNLCITPDSLTKDHSEDSYDNQYEMNFGEINTKTNVSSLNILKIVTQHHEHTVKRNEQEDGEKKMMQKVGSQKYTKASQTFYDRHEGISSACEDYLIEKSESQCE